MASPTPASVVITITLFLLHLLPLNPPATSTPILGLDSFQSQQSRVDPQPQATNDSFLLLPSALKKSLSFTLRPPPTIASLLFLQISVPIYVKLVGLSSSFPSTSPSLFSSFLTVAVSSDHYHVITPFLTNTNHRLSITHPLSLDVSLSSSSLSSKL